MCQSSHLSYRIQKPRPRLVMGHVYITDIFIISQYPLYLFQRRGLIYGLLKLNKGHPIRL